MLVCFRWCSSDFIALQLRIPDNK